MFIRQTVTAGIMMALISFFAPTVIAADQLAELKTGVLKNLTIEATKFDPEDITKVFLGDYYAVKVKSNPAASSDSLSMLVAVHKADLFYLEETSTNVDMPVFASLIQKDFKLKTEADAKTIEAALDTIYPIRFGEEKHKAMSHSNNEWTFIRGDFFKKFSGFVMTTADDGSITAIRFSLGIEKK